MLCIFSFDVYNIWTYIWFLIGIIGHRLKDLVFYGSPWFSWVIASGVVGFIIGLSSKILDIEGNFDKKQIIKFNIVQVIANVVAWFIVAPGLDVLIYLEPASKVFLQGSIGGISNMITVGVLGTIIISAYSKTKIKSGSLRMEE